MADVVRDLLEEIAFILDQLAEAQDALAQEAYLHSAVGLVFLALEAFVNRVSDEVTADKNLSPRERALLEQGAPLDDRVAFLHERFSGRPVDKTVPWWPAFKNALDLRSQLTRSKATPAMTVAGVKDAVEAVIATIDALSREIYKRGFPVVDRPPTRR
jgi:hypothetical protein